MFTHISFITTSLCITASPFSHFYCRYYVSIIINLIDNYTVILFCDTYKSILAWYPFTMQSCNTSLQCHTNIPQWSSTFLTKIKTWLSHEHITVKTHHQPQQLTTHSNNTQQYSNVITHNTQMLTARHTCMWRGYARTHTHTCTSMHT